MKKVFIATLCILLLAGCSNQQSKDNQKKKNTYSMNEDIPITNSVCDIKIKFLDVYETKERNEFADDKPKRVIFLKFQYENISCKNGVYIDNSNLRVYGKDSILLNTYPLKNSKIANTISIGRKDVFEVAYGLNDDNNYLEVEIYNKTDSKFSSKKAVLEW